jgi:hypothetical protein
MEDVENLRLGRAMVDCHSAGVIHVLLTNQEVVTLDVTQYSWSLAFGAKTKRVEVLNTLREWLPPRS